MRYLTSVGVVLAVGALGACTDRLGEEDCGSFDVCEEGGEEEEPEFEPWVLPRSNRIDILFVVDNSGSMAPSERALAEALPVLAAGLEASGADYRIAFTTTDSGNPWCGETTTPERGGLVLSSCRGRLEQFVFTGTNPPTDLTAATCTDVCGLEPEQLDALMLPTRTVPDGELRVRPWVQRGGLEGSNLPDGVATTDALRCFAPMGIDGCGFEQPLESMYGAVSRAADPLDPAHGFIRDDAILAVVFVTDEADCSYRPEWKAIFEASGEKALWSDPDAQYPTSAVCWNAGVRCEGAGGVYQSCDVARKDEHGNETSDASRAVMHAVARYAGLLADIAAEKRSRNPELGVIVDVVTGVPHGYEDGAASILYADIEDPIYMGDFGIGPGCTGTLLDTEVTALPPVRMREFAAPFGERNLHSACEPDYAPAFETILAAVAP